MVIRAGGENWVVEQKDTQPAVPACDHRFMELCFRPEGRDSDRVEIRWVPRTGRLTRRAARRLFDLAGERVWRDPRSGRIHRVHLVDDGDDEAIDHSPHTMRIRFRWNGGEVSTPYRLGRPLGLATPRDLEAMLDEALEA